jgi:hypothetical protein
LFLLSGTLRGPYWREINYDSKLKPYKIATKLLKKGTLPTPDFKSFP